MARLKKIGVLWQRKTKNGRPFLSGFLDNGFHGEDIAIAIFKSQDKQTEKSPDFVIMLMPQTPQSRHNETDTEAITTDDDIPLP